MIQKILKKIVGVDVEEIERCAIRKFLANAYYSHEISPGDYGFLIDKLEGRTDKVLPSPQSESLDASTLRPNDYT